MKTLSLFSGIGAFERGFEMAGINLEIVNYCEWDKCASKSYAAIHNISEKYNLGDITKVDERQLEDFDLMTYGFPCQDISVAGKQAGISEGTRSGLLYEALRIARHKKPKIMIAENVKALVSKKFKPDFEKLLNELEEMGYNNYWKVLNAKDYGIPQNRERVFVISIRKDIDKKTFEWPEPYDNGLRLKDFLEDEVDEKYYISNEKTEKLLQSLKGKEIKPGGIKVSRQGEVYAGNTDTSSTLLARDYKGLGNQQMTAVAVPCLTPDRAEKRQNGRRFKEDGEPMFTLTGQDRHGILQVGSFEKEDINDNERQRRVYSEEGISPTILARTDNAKILQVGMLDIKGNELKLFTNPEGVNITKAKRLGGIFDKENSKHQAGSVWDKEQLCPTLDTAQGGYRQPSVIIEETKISDYRIRKLTPKECWNLMGFTKEDHDKCVAAGISNTQLYKQAGNSIVTNVIAEIATKLKEATNGEISIIPPETQEI